MAKPEETSAPVRKWPKEVYDLSVQVPVQRGKGGRRWVSMRLSCEL